jgi:WD40 repeat protein
MTLRSRGALDSVAFSPDSKRLVTAGTRGAKVWSIVDRLVIANLRGHPRSVRSAAFDRTGTRVVTASLDGKARIFDAASGALRATLSAGRLKRPFGVTVPGVGAQLSPDGRFVAMTSDDGRARVWRVATRELLTVRSSSDPDGVINSAGFSPDGRLLAIASDGSEVELLRSPSWRRVRRLAATDDVVTTAFSADGRLLVEGDADGNARVWRVADGARVAEFSDPSFGVIRAVDISRDGRRVLIAGDDGMARLYTCVECAPYKTVLSTARARVARAFTKPEARRFLHSDG